MRRMQWGLGKSLPSKRGVLASMVGFMAPIVSIIWDRDEIKRLCAKDDQRLARLRVNYRGAKACAPRCCPMLKSDRGHL